MPSPKYITMPSSLAYTVSITMTSSLIFKAPLFRLQKIFPSTYCHVIGCTQPFSGNNSMQFFCSIAENQLIWAAPANKKSAPAPPLKRRLQAAPAPQHCISVRLLRAVLMRLFLLCQNVALPIYDAIFYYNENWF